MFRLILENNHWRIYTCHNRRISVSINKHLGLTILNNYNNIFINSGIKIYKRIK